MKPAPFQTLSQQERERMTELLDLLSSAPEGGVSAPIHDKIGALAELELLLAAHNANGSAFVRELVVGELDQLRSDLHTIYEPLKLVLENTTSRLEALSERQDRMDMRIVVVEEKQDAVEQRVTGIDRRQDRLEIRVRLNSVLIALTALIGLFLTVILHLVLP